MKKWLWCILLLAVIPLLGIGSLGGRDVGTLRPVRVLEAQQKNGQLFLVADTEDRGRGETSEQAVASMNESSQNYVFLETAQVLLLREGTERYIPELMQYLRPSCSVCAATGEMDLSTVAKYLKQHPPQLTLGEYAAGKQELPRLISEGGKMQLVQ